MAEKYNFNIDDSSLEDRQRAMKQRLMDKNVDSTEREDLADIRKQSQEAIYFSKAQIHRYFKSAFVVYIYWKNITKGHKIALYVGFSVKGISRPFNITHECCLEFLEADSLEVLYFVSPELARNAETRLIKLLTPKNNYSGSSKKEKPLVVKI